MDSLTQSTTISSMSRLWDLASSLIARRLFRDSFIREMVKYALAFRLDYQDIVHNLQKHRSVSCTNFGLGRSSRSYRDPRHLCLVIHFLIPSGQPLGRRVGLKKEATPH
jgi:hypothetical protein